MKKWMNIWKFSGLLLCLMCLMLVIAGVWFAIMNPRPGEIMLGSVWVLIGVVNTKNLIKAGVFS